MAQKGYVRTLNFFETKEESRGRDILDNLLISGASNDLGLFANNLRRTTELPASAYTANGTVYTITEEGYIAFSNGTTVRESLDLDKVYTVVNSRGRETFELLDENENKVTLAQPVALQRSNAVTNENIDNLNKLRLDTVAGLSDDTEFETLGFGDTTILESYALIDSTITNVEYKDLRSILSTRDNNFDENFIFSGYVRIVNDSQKARTDTSPGIFIVISDDLAARAFEDDSNPWTESGTALVASQPTEATINDLYASNANISGWSETSETNSALDFTHTVRISVNNEEYHLLLTEIT